MKTIYKRTKFSSFMKQNINRLGLIATITLLVSACGSVSNPSGNETNNDVDDGGNDTVDNSTGNTGGGNTGGGNSNGGDSHAGHMGHCSMIPSFASVGMMTIAAQQSGDWSNANTWGGSLPNEGANVHIPENIEVTVDGILASRHETVRVDGTLKFATAANTELKVDTLVSSCSGKLEIGSMAQPIQPNVKARVLFIDDGVVNDTKLVSRGAILIGQTTMYGAAKTHRAVISPHARSGDTSLTLSSTPSGWAVNDELVVTGTIPNNPASDEIRRIASINGNQVTLDSALNLDHVAPKTDLNVYVANITRNIEFVSENTAIRNRGHMMFMSHNVDIQNARFTELGRTDKTTPLNDFEFMFPDEGSGDDAPDTATLSALGGTNVRGRYVIHFHQNGTNPNSTPALVKGSVAFNGPGWGFVNHSSHVNFIDNVSYGLQGAGFYTEAGDEIGSMQGNIAIRSVNSAFTTDHLGAIDPDLRAGFMDYGNDGDGYWLTGTRVSMINNVSAGASAHGIIYWTDGVMEPNAGTGTASRVTVSVDSLPNGNLIPNRTRVPVWWAPLAESRGNESYGSTIGFRVRYVHAKNYLGRDEQSDFHRSPPQAYINTLSPVINDLVVWGSRDGVLLNYNERLSLSNARIVGFGKDMSEFRANDGTAKTGVGLDVGNEATHGPANIQNVTVEGFGAGFVTPVNGTWQVQNLALSGNDSDMYIQPTGDVPTQVQFQNVSYTSFIDSEVQNASVLPSHISVNN